MFGKYISPVDPMGVTYGETGESFSDAGGHAPSGAEFRGVATLSPRLAKNNGVIVLLSQWLTF